MPANVLQKTDNARHAVYMKMAKSTSLMDSNGALKIDVSLNRSRIDPKLVLTHWSPHFGRINGRQPALVKFKQTFLLQIQPEKIA